MGFLMRAFIAALVAAALFTQVAYAQHKAAPEGPTDKQKADARAKRDFEKDTDDAYKASIDRIPDAKKTVDPWGSLRAPADQAGKK